MDNNNSDKGGLTADNNPVVSWIIIVVFFTIGGVGSLLLVPNSNFVVFVVIGIVIASPFWILLTESGAQWFMNKTNDSKSNQSQTINTTSTSDREITCHNCGWENPVENNFCYDCGEELELPDDNPDSQAAKTADHNENSGTAKEEVSSLTEDSDEDFKFGVSRDILAVATYISSLLGGLLLGVWFLAQGNLMISGSILLIAVGWPLITKRGRAAVGQKPGRERRPRRKNEPSSNTKECTECGWHNHQANNNCVECDARF
ncbi:hypothetical protein GCM10008995_01510 [Halobellus salinus]|uniref:Zinc ribbon domain-containing protein n=1 Tax=Halobellus salinus TaxID=931585 RepID=A0A830ENS9_9EURY|nr:hypothetical protein [Halobellus salinus]GGI95000.1 hypothetical protein GCM10008995_01510 [Halobellus salinus]SMP20472.1 hypothetical protein SAMN06265347_107157 [Halobellus salinus]